MRHAVILAGGSGIRFWPQSRHNLPKQLTAVVGSRTLIQETLDRSLLTIPAEQTWVVTNSAQSEETARQLPAVPGEQILVEPCGRNTAPCIGLAALHCRHTDADATMVVMPSDHVIAPAEQFAAVIDQAAAYVDRAPPTLMLLGIRPTFPATGYGYIEQGEALEGGISRVRTFREKPDRATAETFLNSGTFFWNCGIFVWKAQTILDEIARHAPRLGDLLQRLAPLVGSDEYDARVAEIFPRMESISIDYAVLERATTAAMVEAPFEWDDVGSWEALPRLLGTDEQGNCISAQHTGVNTTNCIVRSRPGHLVATSGVDNLVIVHTESATLVARRDDEAALRELVRTIEAEGHHDYL